MSEEHEKFYNQLVANSESVRLLESLKRVKEACGYLETQRVAITPTSVGNHCTQMWGGPKAQSIRNAKGTLFKYLQARRATQVLPAVQSKSYAPIIKDENVRAYVTLLKSQLDQALGENKRLHNGLRSIPGIPIDELLANGFKSDGAQNLRAPSRNVKKALENLFAPSRLENVGLELYRDRIRSPVTGAVLLEKRDVNALMALLSGEAENVIESDNNLLADESK